MRDGSFRHGVTLRELGAKWGLGEVRMHELSALASKKVRAEIVDPDLLAAKGFSRLEKIADDAMSEYDKDGNNTGHRKLALAATAELLKLSGVATVKTKVEVTGFEQLSDEQLEARKRELLARLGTKGADR